jgi:HlyD family secretion protein
MNVQARMESFGQQIARRKWILGFVAATVLLALFALYRSKSTGTIPAEADTPAPTATAQPPAPNASSPGTAVKVDVVRPMVGGITRSISEPGTVKAFQYADLYAKVSGYLEVQNVDIGDAVKKSELLAKIFSPELVEAVEQAEAHLDQAKAQVKLADAGIDRAKADLKASDANVNEKQADLKRETAYLAYRQIQYERIKHLYELKAIEEKLVDQNLKDRDAAVEAKNAAKAAIETAKAEVSAKEAKVVEARADLANAKAKVQVAAAELAKAKVFEGYLEIRSPYTGVVTKRTYHEGDFIRAADQGSGAATPLLIVARTDKMRVEMKMPEAYVRYTDKGDPATVELDALAGKEFHGKVSRIGNSLDPNDRTMRVEVDLENKDNELRDGFFGRVTVQLSRSAKEVSVPSTCLVSSVEGTTTSVYVLQDGEARLRPVKVGRDNGIQAEIISGLKPDELVVLHPTSDLFSGEKVVPVEKSNTTAAPSGNAK